MTKDEALKMAPAQELVKQKVKVLYEKNGIQTCEILPAPSWQGLSDDEIDSVWFKVVKENNFEGTGKYFGRAIEQALKEKNNAV